MNTLKYTTALVLGSLIIATACTDMDVLPESNYLTNKQKAEAPAKLPGLSAADLTGMYNKIASPGSVLGTTAYDGFAYPDDGGYPLICMFFDLNGPDATSPNTGFNWMSTSGLWQDRTYSYRNPRLRWALFYQQIKAANDIIRNIDKETASTEELEVLGQALAVRAFDLLSLAPYYQFKYNGHENELCVPIITEVTDGDEFPRNTVAEVYNQIINDLTTSIDYLKNFERKSKIAIDASVAYGLRARAYLAMEKWNEAAADATKALELCTGDCDGQPAKIEEVSQPAFCDIDIDSSHNWMWGINMTGTQINGEYASWPSWIGSFSGDAYSTGAAVYYCINSMLYNKIPKTDVRKGWWVDENLHSDNLASVTWAGASGDDVATLTIENTKEKFLPYTNVKFAQKDGCGDSNNGGDWCIMRVEEMILIQAEAYAKAGDEAKGKQILENFIKTYRDPAYVQTCASFADEVWKQRRIELWGEGFSMSDIMRLGKNVVRFHSGEECSIDEDYQFNIEYGDPYMLLRIPQTEMNSNTAMVQNIGGNAPVIGQNGNLRDGVTD